MWEIKKEAKVFDPGFQIRGLSGALEATHKYGREQAECVNDFERDAIDNAERKEKHLCKVEYDVVEIRKPTGDIVEMDFRAGQLEEKIRATMM